MSKTIEQKVVEMRFDNSNFEKNVSQSMNTLDKLQNAIDKTSSGNAFSGLSKAIDNLNFGSVTTAIQTVTEKFSVWEEIAIGAARNIGVALSNYVVKGLNDMVFSNVTAGWDKYAQKTEAVQTIMASINDQDFGNVDKMEYVSGVLEKLNWFTDETSFHFTDMVSSIGKFTSAGVDLEKASDAMMGIATWAAVSGANADTASRVMYQLSQSLGMGSVKAQDWMSVETANMATKEFKELAIQVAKAKGEITSSGKAKNGGKKAVVVDFKNFKDTLKDGWLTSDVLTESLAQYSSAVDILNRTYYALGEDVPTSRILPVLEEAFDKAGKSGEKLEEVFTGLIEEEWGDKLEDELDFSILDENGKRIGSLADKVTELGLRAFRAGQEAKTFAEAIGSVPDAASTVWMQIWEKIFGDYETAKVLWTDLANYLYDIFVQPLWKVWDVIDEWQSAGGRDILFGRGETGKVEDATGAFYIMFETIKNVESAFMEAFGEVFPFGGNNLIKLSRKLQNFAKRTRVSAENVKDLTKKFKDFFQFFKDILDSIDVFNQKSEDSWNWIGMIKKRFEDTFGRVETVLNRVKSIIGYVKEGFVQFFDALKFKGTAIQNFGDTAENVGKIANDFAKALSPIKLIFSNIGKFGKSAGTVISNLLAALSFIPKEITGIVHNTDLLYWGAKVLQDTLAAVKEGFNEAFDSAIFADIQEMFKHVWGAIESFINGFTSKFNVYDKIRTIFKGIGSAANLLGRAIQFLLTPIKRLNELGVFTELGKFLGGTVINALLSIPAAIAKIVSKLDEFISKNPAVLEIVEGISTIFGSIIKFVFSAANAFSDFIKETKPLAKVRDFIKGIFTGFKDSDEAVDAGNKIFDAFRKVVEFFNNEFTFENFLKWFEEAEKKANELKENIKKLFSGETEFEGFGSGPIEKIEKFMSSIESKIAEVKAKVKDFIENFNLISSVHDVIVYRILNPLDELVKKSEFLSRIKKNFGDLFNNIKKLFSGETNFEGFGADFMAGFGKGLVDNVQVALTKIREVGQKVLDAIKNFFGIHSPSTVMAEVGKDLVYGFSNGIKDAIKKPIEAIKKVAGVAFDGLTSMLFGGKAAGGLESSEKETEKSVSVIDNIKKWLASFAKKIIGIGAMTIPPILVFRAAKAIMSPFEAVRNVTSALNWKMIGDTIVNGLSALGDALKKVLLSIGGLVLMFAAAAALMAVVKKYTEGENGEDNLFGPMAGLIGMISDVLILVGSMATVLAKIEGHSSTTLSGGLKDKGGKFERKMNETAEWIAAIGDIFVQLGEAMLLLAGAVAVMAFASKQFGSDVVEDVMLYFGVFTAVLAVAGTLIAKFGGGETKTKAGLKWKTGISFEHNGYTEGLYAIGLFMMSVGTAMAAMSLAASIVIKAANGDVKQIEAAFQGMIGIMAVAMVALVGIAYIQEKTPSKGVKKSTSAIRDAAFALATVAGAIRVIAKTIIMLGKEDDGKVQQGLKVIYQIAPIIIAFGAIAALSDKKLLSNAKGLGLLLLGISASFAIFAVAIAKIGEMDSTKLDYSMRILTTFALFFGVISAVSILATNATKDSKFGAIGFMLMEIAAALVIMSGALTMLDSIENMGSAILGLLGSVAALGLLFAEVAVISTKNDVNPKKFAGLAASMLIISTSMLIMSKALVNIGSIANMGSAIVGLTTIFLALGLLFAEVAIVTSNESVNTKKFMALSASMLIVTLAVSEMGDALIKVGSISDMGKAIGGLVTVFLALGLLFAAVAATGIIGEDKVSGMIGSSIALMLVAASISAVVETMALAGKVFSENEGSLKAGAIAVGLVVGALAVIAGLAYAASKPMLLFGAGVAAIGAGLLLLSLGAAVLIETLVTMQDKASSVGVALVVAFGAFLDAFIKLGPKISSAIAMIFKAIADGIVESAEDIIKAAVKLIEVIGKNIDTILGMLGPILDKLIAFIVEKVTLLVTLLQPLVENIVNHIMTVLNTILVPGIITGGQTILTWILTSIPIIANVIVSTVEMIVTRVLALLDLMVNSEMGILAIIRRALMGENGVLTIVEEFIHQLFEALKKLVPDLIDTILFILQEVVNGVIDGIDILLTGVEDVINMVAEHIVSLTDTILQSIVDVLNGIAKSIEDHGADIFGAIGRVVAALIKAFGDFLFGGADDPNSLLHLGKEIITGLGKGLTQFVGDVVGTVTEVAGKIVDGFKSFFHIKSPSRVMMEIGGYLDKGLAKGIDDESSSPIKSITGLGGGIIDSLKSTFLGDDVDNITGLFGDNISGGLTDALGGITDVLDTDDFTPTITPVLDLSEIQNGASQIPGMINPGSGYTVNTAMVSKSAYNPYEYYDGTERIAAPEAQLDYFEMLKAKMDEVVNKFGNAKVVLDTGAVVGGIVGPMDMALGQRMAQVGRGVYSSTR